MSYNTKILLICLLFVLAGIFFLIRNVLLILNDKKLEKYLNESPKAKIWINKLGFEKTKKLSKTIFIPIGTVISITFIIAGTIKIIELVTTIG